MSISKKSDIKLSPKEWRKIIKQALELSKIAQDIEDRRIRKDQAIERLNRFRKIYAHPEAQNPGVSKDKKPKTKNKKTNDGDLDCRYR